MLAVWKASSIYTAITNVSDLQNDFKCPCIVFTGHPSLRFGDVIHFIEMWGKSSSNTIIFTGKILLNTILLFFQTVQWKGRLRGRLVKQAQPSVE